MLKHIEKQQILL